tara:strand:- start:779 stop:1180 length:402 start_codon:yes stop_codon:yes gene_type:complete
MTSVLNVDTIADKAGTGPVGLTKQSANKAYINFNGGGVTIRGSFNVSSVTDNATGDFTLNFTNSMANDDFSVGGFSGFGDGYASDENTGGIGFVRGSTTPLTTSYLRVSSHNNNNYGAEDLSYLSTIIDGDLA